MTFMRRYGCSAGFNFLLSVLTIQWAILTNAITHYVVESIAGTHEASAAGAPFVSLDITSLITGDFAAGAILISFGTARKRRHSCSSWFPSSCSSTA